MHILGMLAAKLRFVACAIAERTPEQRVFGSTSTRYVLTCFVYFFIASFSFIVCSFLFIYTCDIVSVIINIIELYDCLYRYIKQTYT